MPAARVRNRRFSRDAATAIAISTVAQIATEPMASGSWNQPRENAASLASGCSGTTTVVVGVTVVGVGAAEPDAAVVSLSVSMAATVVDTSAAGSAAGGASGAAA